MIYKDYYINVYRKIKNILYSEVDDDITSCVQETYIIAWSKIDELKNHKNAAGWLVLTAQNVARNFNRLYLIRQNIIADSKDMEGIAQEDDFTEHIAGELTAEMILSRLSPDERKLYELRYVINLSNEDIGKILGITPKAVSERKSRLLKKLKGFILSEK